MSQSLITYDYNEKNNILSLGINLNYLPRNIKRNHTTGYMCCLNMCSIHNSRFKVINEIDSYIFEELKNVKNEKQFHCVLKDITLNTAMEYKYNFYEDDVNVLNLNNVEIKKNFNDYRVYASGIVYYHDLPKLLEEKLYCGFTRIKPTKEELQSFKYTILDKYGNLIKIGNNRGDMKLFSCGVIGVDIFFVESKSLEVSKSGLISGIIVGVVLFVGLCILIYVVYYQDKKTNKYLEEENNDFSNMNLNLI